MQQTNEPLDTIIDLSSFYSDIEEIKEYLIENKLFDDALKTVFEGLEMKFEVIIHSEITKLRYDPQKENEKKKEKKHKKKHKKKRAKSVEKNVE